MRYYFLLLIFFLLRSFPAHSQANEHYITTVKVGVYNNSPKIFINEMGEADGIFIDVIEEIAQNEGFQIEYVFSNWNDLKSKLLENQIDILPDMSYSAERDSLFIFNKIPVLNSWLEVYTTKKIVIKSLKDLGHLRIGLLKGSIQESILHKEIKSKAHNGLLLYSFLDYQSMIEALKQDEIDVIVASRFFYFSQFLDKEVVSTNIVFNETKLLFAFSNSGPEWFPAVFDRHISSMRNEPTSIYYASLDRFLTKKNNIPTFILWPLGIIVLVLILVSTFVFILRNRVNIKTKEITLKNIDLQKASKLAEESNRLKTAFLSNMSHEIRTPLNGIIGFAALLKDAHFSHEEKQEYVEIINTSSERLLHTIHDLIDISKIEADQMMVYSSSFSINQLLQELFDSLEKLAQKKNLILELHQNIATEKHIIFSDKTKLFAILNNLVKNAIKYTKEGKVSIGYYFKDQDIIIYVNDTGIGIPKDRKRAIFNRFEQADIEDKDAFEGSGLGLAISNAYAELLNGSISVDTIEGKGSSFALSIPQQYRQLLQSKGSPMITEKEPMVFLKVLANILIVERNELAFLYLQRMFTGVVHSIRHLRSNLLIEEFCEEFPDTNVVLMSINGDKDLVYEAVKKINKANKNLFLIAQTAKINSLEKQKALDAGFHAVLSQPIVLQEFLGVINAHFEGK
ncbi:MAG: hypothetical protein B7C24_14425 [Bacteroidetes bacterium 4572_77]|nr:MAG: hypothetical protein B7C24_14425 [Bacteroidetes bacterium 4572_77]